MIAILNGPPGSGKDTIANIMVNNHDVTKTEFKYDLYKEVAKHFDLPLKYVEYMCKDRDLKDEYSKFFKSTPREAMIYVSEEIIKPRHGKDYFGKKLLQRQLQLGTLDGLVVVSDGGFVDEVMPLTSATSVLVVRLYGRGNFDEDSRDYLVDERFNYLDVELVTGRPTKAVKQIMKHIVKNYDYI